MARPAHPQAPWIRSQPLLLTIAVFPGSGRWLARGWQWTIADQVLLVGVCGIALVLWTWPPPMILVAVALAASVFVSLRLPRHGFTLIDVAILLALILLTTAFLLPAMDRTRTLAMGQRFIPSSVRQATPAPLTGGPTCMPPGGMIPIPIRDDDGRMIAGSRPEDF